MGAKQIAEHALAVPLAIGPGGIEEIAPQAHRFVECGTGTRVIGAGPATEAPHAVADFTDLPAESAEAPVTHVAQIQTSDGAVMAPPASPVFTVPTGSISIK